MSSSNPLVSIIIPCYNQARFLGEAIESVLGQTYPHYEMLVIDDGSTDPTARVASNYPNITFLRQENQGPSVARNLGVSKSRGEYLVFLDADDRLLPEALYRGVVALNICPDCAFVSGRFRYVDGDGKVLPTWREIREGNRSGITSQGWQLIGSNGVVLEKKGASEPVFQNHFAALLERNYIEMPSTVMYRREVFLVAGGFDPTLRAAEDYDVFLRIARQYPITCHNHVIADYRQHSANTTRDKAGMLLGALQVLDRQRSCIHDDARYSQALRIGVAAFFDHYGFWSILEPFFRLKPAAWRNTKVVMRFIGWYIYQKVLSLQSSIFAGRRPEAPGL